MPTARMPEERSSLSRNGARIAVEIGEAATDARERGRDVLLAESDQRERHAHVDRAQEGDLGRAPPEPFHAPRRRASGNSTSAASPQRIEVISAAENERRPILMKR